MPIGLDNVLIETQFIAYLKKDKIKELLGKEQFFKGVIFV
jgi:hypothetical protein